MPFTLSHAAAVLPLVDGPWVASALVAGALAPDLPYYLESVWPGSYVAGAVTHRWWAVPTVDVAVAGGLVLLWHGLARRPLVGVLPEPWAGVAEAVTAPRGGWRTPGRAWWFLGSAAVGAGTHLGLDAFTHRSAVGRLPGAGRVVAGVPVYEALQYGTSVVGLGLLARHVLRLGREVEPEPVEVSPRRRAVWAGLGAATVVGAALRLARRERGFIGELCFGAGAGLALGVIGYAVGARVPGGTVNGQCHRAAA
ncbi:hypothetical protein CFP65_6671 [Kitasatospora sp. MMS16-BH015]|uniref:DUF4184 family protein n=1 Tax=Kitasatospora sp. MMS16-BH015 TaxID=2018025 RepID=UPI000CA0BBED|nr:DUF4184 family protein [Kitasatospora sp. MMS16-BH015]AUG81316.1 hypothetical protein CFP65_6671 [Kitasatospora sp. MMS16-BH015]